MNPRRLTMVAVLATFIVASCALNPKERDAVSKFGKAASALGKTGYDQLVQMRQETIEMDARRLAITGPVKGTPGLDDLDRALDPKAVESRMKAMKALQKYGEALKTLLDESRKDQIDKASADFAASIGEVDELGLSQDQINALSKAVAAIGKVVVEEVRAKKIRESVSYVHEDLDRLSDLLITCFDPNGADLANSFQLASSDLMVAAADEYCKANDPAVRASALKDYCYAQTNLEQLEELKKISQALEKFKKANDQMARLVLHEKITPEDIQEFYSTVQSLSVVKDLFATKN